MQDDWIKEAFEKAMITKEIADKIGKAFAENFDTLMDSVVSGALPAGKRETLLLFASIGDNYESLNAIARMFFIGGYMLGAQSGKEKKTDV